MTKNVIILVLAISINIVNFAFIQTIRKHQVRLLFFECSLYVDMLIGD